MRCRQPAYAVTRELPAGRVRRTSNPELGSARVPLRGYLCPFKSGHPNLILIRHCRDMRLDLPRVLTPRIGQWVALASLALCTALVLLSVERPINNGDWYRVTQFGGFYPELWKPLTSAYGFRHGPRLGHSTTMALLVATLSYMGRALGSPSFGSILTMIVLHGTFIGGLFYFAACFRFSKWIAVCGGLTLTYLCFGFLLGSYYEEATVLALAPWLCAGYLQMLHRGRCGMFAIAGSLIIYSKIQMIIIAPLFGLVLFVGMRGKRKSIRFVLGMACLIGTSAFAANSAHSQNKDPNSYNRYYNGIGWSMLDAWRWPANEFHGRHTHYYANRDALAVDEPGILRHDLMGTSFWPTAATLENSQEYAAAVRQGDALSYVRFIASNPKIAWSLARNTYAISLSSDYELAYLRADPLFSRLACDVLAIPRRLTLRFFGAVCALVLIATLVMQRTILQLSITAWLLLATPALVVAGDGFFEFEKHMVPYMMLMPFFILPALVPPPAAAAPAIHPEPASHTLTAQDRRRSRGQGTRASMKGKREGKRR